MSRTHIHCASGLSEAVQSGMRDDCDVVIVIDMAAASADGVEFRRSSNGVLLTTGNAEQRYDFG